MLKHRNNKYSVINLLKGGNNYCRLLKIINRKKLMKILTFDTSTETMFVTIGNDSDVNAYKIIETTEKSYNSAHLIPVIIELLQSQNLMTENIEAIGVNIGPGSFTGVRASATVAKVMAQQLDIPVVGVSSLEIYSLLNNTEKPSLCLLDARRGKAYMAVYGNDGEIIQEPQAIEYEKAVEFAKNGNYFIIADKKMSEIIKDSGLECLNLSESKENFGVFLAELTYKYLSKGLRLPRQDSQAVLPRNDDIYRWHNLKPLYIQPPPISTAKRVQ